MSAKAQGWARRYIERGFAPIPIPARSKNPNREGWQNERHGLEDVDRVWSNGQSVGLLTGAPSAWLVDVDLDVPEAVSVAGRFLGPTRTSGHGDALDSHWWYFSEGIETKMFYDTDGRKRLIELRADGCQTLVAPSVHPGGEVYAWNSALEIERVTANELRYDINKLATAVLVARHLPEHRKLGGGGRHDYALALAGFMLRDSRLVGETVLAILLAAWDAKAWPSEKARREAHRDLERAVEDTVGKLGQGKKVTGGRRLEEMEPGLAERIADYWGWSERDENENAPDEKEERRNQADRLIGYALEDAQELFVDQHGAAHALVGGESLPLTSRCYSWLRRLMWEREEKAVNGEYLKTTAGTLAAHAEFSGEVRDLHTRVAWHEDTLYYELRPGRVVRCGVGGWGFEDKPPVLFRRYPNLKDLPDPKPEDTLDVLDNLVNLKSDRDRRLFKAYLATVALPHVGRPILNAAGAMGSGKTTIGRVVKRTWDPTAPETVRYDPRDFLQKALHAYVLMLDNLNALPEPAADTLCRLVTGEADSKRRLYTDDEDVIIELRRAVLLNGINVPTERSDVLDRSLVVELERIPDAERETEERLWERFEAERPRLLGTLFSVLAQAIALKPSLRLSRRPRLADWGEYAAAVYEVLGWGAETFLDDWDEVVKVQNQATLDGSPAAQVIMKFVQDEGTFAGTSSELHYKLKPIAEKLGVDRDKAWPKSARWLWRRIKEVLPVLSAAGIEARRDHSESGTVIALRGTPTNDVSDVSWGESRLDRLKEADNKDGADVSPNVRSESNVSSDVSGNSAYLSTSDITDNTDIRSGAKSEPLSADLKPGESATLRELKARRLSSDGLTVEAVLTEFAGKSPSRRMLDRYLEIPSEQRSEENFEYLAKTVIYSLVDLPRSERNKDAWRAYAPVVEAALKDWEGEA